MRRVSERAGWASDTAGRTSEGAGRAPDGAGWTSVPVGRALEPAGRAPESAGRAPEPAGDGKKKKRKINRALPVCGGTIGHCSLRGRCPKIRTIRKKLGHLK